MYRMSSTDRQKIKNQELTTKKVRGDHFLIRALVMRGRFFVLNGSVETRETSMCRYTRRATATLRSGIVENAVSDDATPQVSCALSFFRKVLGSRKHVSGEGN